MKHESSPPLTWLRAFEAAGRTGSFKEAADELAVSTSTISHQIRDLEAHLGVPLFDRSGRGVELTREGAQYLPSLQAGFKLIRDARADILESQKVFKVGAFPFIANEIITPAILELQNRLGVESIKVYSRNDTTLLTEVDPENRLDAVIRYGSHGKGFPGLSGRLLTHLSLVPISHTSFKMESLESLLSQPLIRVLGPFDGWERWRNQYLPGHSLSFSIETDSFHSALLAVERGEGICIGILPSINPWLRAGRIKALDDISLTIEDHSTYLVYGQHNVANPAIDEFAIWLQETLG